MLISIYYTVYYNNSCQYSTKTKLLFLLQLVNIEGTTANMAGTKVEIKMKKDEAGSWAKLFIPKEVSNG